MQLFAKYYAISIYVMQIVTPSENTLRNKANFCANSFQRLKTFGFSWQHYIKNSNHDDGLFTFYSIFAFE